MTYYTIQSFEPIFSKLGFTHPRSSAAYYVILIQQEFPIEFEDIKNRAKDLYGYDITPNRLRQGRDELLKYGFIAQVISTDPITIKEKMFGREAYLPVNPSLVWELNKNKLVTESEPKTPLFLDSDMAEMHRRVDGLQSRFREKYKKNGLAIDKGSVTARYGKPWVLYTLINNSDENSVLSLMLSGLGSFSQDYVRFHIKMLELGARINVIYQTPENTGLDAVKSVQKEFPNKINIRFFSLDPVTSRRALIGDKLAIDGRKIVSDKANENDASKKSKSKRKNSKLNLKTNEDDPSYIGTVYLEKKIINKLRKYFNYIWTDPYLELETESAISLGVKGFTLASLGKHKDAIEYYKKAIEQNPPVAAEFWYFKGLSLLVLDLKKEAEFAFAKAKELGYPS